MSVPRHLRVIDCYGLTAEQVRDNYPKLYQWLINKVKPERDVQRDKDLREKWWLHRRNNEDLRRSLKGLDKYIATAQTAKHRVFIFLEKDILPDDKLIAIALEEAQWFGIISSRIHVLWALAAGSALGVGNDPVYNKSRCFEAFPFPSPSEALCNRITELAQRIDSHRRDRQIQNPDLTLTAIYNVLEKERTEHPFTPQERAIHEQGLISVLKELHDELDQAVFEAYGWDDLAEKLVGLPGATTPRPDKPQEQADAEEELLMRLVELNKQRAAEEAKGRVRWLRPEYQAPEETQQEAELETDQPEQAVTVTAKDTSKPSLPKDLSKQITTVRDLLSQTPQTTESLAAQFKNKPKVSVEKVLDALNALGQVQKDDGMWRLVK